VREREEDGSSGSLALPPFPLDVGLSCSSCSFCHGRGRRWVEGRRFEPGASVGSHSARVER